MWVGGFEHKVKVRIKARGGVWGFVVAMVYEGCTLNGKIDSWSITCLEVYFFIVLGLRVL